MRGRSAFKKTPCGFDFVEDAIKRVIKYEIRRLRDCWRFICLLSLRKVCSKSLAKNKKRKSKISSNV